RGLAAVAGRARRRRPEGSRPFVRRPRPRHPDGPGRRTGHRRRQLARAPGSPGVLAVDALCRRRLLRPSHRLERDRVRRTGLPEGVQEPGPRQAGTLGGAGGGGPPPASPSGRVRRRQGRPGRIRRRGGQRGRRRVSPGGRLMAGRVRRRNESAWLLPNDGTRTNHGLRRDMRRYGDDEEVDLAVVGCGAGGGVLTQRLARRGWRVVAFDAGPFWDPDQDWVSDEAGAHALYWNEPRVID